MEFSVSRSKNAGQPKHMMMLKGVWTQGSNKQKKMKIYSTGNSMCLLWQGGAIVHSKIKKNQNILKDGLIILYLLVGVFSQK